MDKTGLANQLMVYRNILTIPRDVKFGLEIEIDNTDYDLVYKRITNNFGNQYAIKDDLSLTLGKNAEIATPVFTNTKDQMMELKKLANAIKNLEHDFEGASFQINFDQSLLKNKEEKIKLLKLFSMYEELIYFFSRGYDKNIRLNACVYANPITLHLKGLLNKSDDDIIDFFTDKKLFGINFKSNKDLIEIRCPNGTDNIVLWQNYITFFYYFIMYVKNNKINMNELDKFIDEFPNKDILLEYNEDFSMANKLANDLFSKTIDKVYFLKQYSKR